MGGAWLQLSAFGSANQYLEGDPQVTFFRTTTRRHTPFALEAIEIPFSGTVELGKRCTALVPRSTGDLLAGAWLQVTLPDLADYTATPSATYKKWCNSVGHALLASVELEIGGARIDRITGEWLDAWSELTEPEEKLAGFHEMVGKYSNYDPSSNSLSSGGQRTYYIPLNFYFSRQAGQSIPLVALSLHDVRFNFEFRGWRDLVKSNVVLTSLLNSGAPPEFVSCRLYGEFVFLDQPERQRFASVPSEYLVECLQIQEEAVLSSTVNRKITLNFNHPVKELVWAYIPAEYYQSDSLAGNRWMDYSIPNLATQDPFESVTLLLNGSPRFSERPGQYFRLAQPYKHHTRVPKKFLYCYSFALEPENVSPSGALNFSRVDSAQMVFKMHDGIANGKIRVWAVNYNLLRVNQGMAGLSFAS